MRSWIARPILAALATALAHGVPLLRIPRRRSSLLSLDRSKRPDAGQMSSPVTIDAGR
jgi:hypothetical protein